MFNEPYNSDSSDNAGSDEMTNLANHHTSHKNEDTAGPADTLPAELGPIHQQLVTIGEEWRARMPPADRLVSYARNVAAMQIPQHTDAELDTTALSHETSAMNMAIGYVASEPRFSSAQRAENRFRLLVAVAASLVVVTLLAGVFAMFAPDRFAGKGSATHTPTARPTIGPVTGEWITPPQLNNLSNAPLIAPSDPRIIYEEGTQLKRSDDGGTTWRVIPTPSFSGAAVSNVTVGGIRIGSLDPNTVEIQVNVGLSSSDSSLCPAGTQSSNNMISFALSGSSMDSTNMAMVASDQPSQPSVLSLEPSDPGTATPTSTGPVTCSAEFSSRDGGAHWKLVHGPIGLYGPIGPNGPYLQGQGDRLYGVWFERGSNGFHIVTSTDAANWQLVSAPPIAQDQHICDVRATPTGTTIFALTFEKCFSDAPGKRQVWRSDDAGTHWRLMGTLSAPMARLVAVTPSDTGGWLLYAGTSDVNQVGSFRMHVSSDGGATWQEAPKTGIQTGQIPFGAMEGTLADDSIVEAFASTSGPSVTLTFYAWRAGDSAWRWVSPPITLNENRWQDITLLAVPGASGQRNQLWITQSDRYSKTYLMYRFDV